MHSGGLLLDLDAEADKGCWGLVTNTCKPVVTVLFPGVRRQVLLTTHAYLPLHQVSEVEDSEDSERQSSEYGRMRQKLWTGKDCFAYCNAEEERANIGRLPVLIQQKLPPPPERWQAIRRAWHLVNLIFKQMHYE